MKRMRKMNRRKSFSDLIFLLIILFLAAASFISYQRIIKLNDATNLVVHTNIVKLKLAQTLSLLRETETRQEDSIQTRVGLIDVQIQSDSSDVDRTLYDLDSLIQDNPYQQVRVHRIQSLWHDWIRHMHGEAAKSAVPTGHFSEFSLQGQSTIHQIEGIIHEMTEMEDNLSSKRMREKDRSAFLTPVYSLLFSFLAILFVTGAYFRLRYETRLRMKAEDGQAIIRNFFDQAPVMLAIFKGPDHIFEFANQPFRELIGDRNPINLPVREAVPEAVGQGYIDILDNVYRTGVPYIGREMPLPLDRGKGVEQLFITFICQTLKNLAGQTEGILVFCYEVSEQVAARNKLQEAEIRSRLAIEAARMGTFDWDMQNQHFISSERLVEIFGYQGAEHVNHQDLIDRINPEDKSIRDEAVNKSLSQGSMKYEIRIIWPDKSIHWINVFGKIVTDNEKNILRMYGTVMDITPQKIALEEIKESESKFRLLANAMPQLIWTTDKNGNLKYFNEAVYDFSGLGIKELKNKGWLSIVHPDELKENIRKWVHSIDTGKEFLFEHRFRNVKGEYRWQLSRAIPQKDDQGNIQMWIGTSTDIHEQKNFMQELEKKVFERTRSLNFANLALKQSVAELEQSNAELGSFNYIASHDLQEPLRKIIAFSKHIEEVEQETLSDTSRDYFNRIINAVSRMQSLIDAFLTYSQTGNTHVAFEMTDFNKVLLDVQNDFAEAIEQKKIKLEVQRLPIVPAIPIQVHQLFTNLIGNSIKYSRTTVSPRIGITSESVAGKDLSYDGIDTGITYWQISIADNGIGFDQIYETQIFELFQRLHSRQEYAGTGIGLAICKKIMRNHRGFISAVGRDGEGATFSIYFPIKPDPGLPIKTSELAVQ